MQEGAAPSAPQYYNSARWDVFDRWSSDRRAADLGAASAAYLPEELGTYASSFDRYGTWRQEANYGYVWFPAVTSGWRPYSSGYWRTYDPWGSFWVASDPWGWPTHHYGRWGYSTSFGWYWMPARVWGPSWVYWAYDNDYVSWCALGWNDYPVFGNWGVHGAYVGYHDPWHGWSVMSRQHFASHRYDPHSGIDGHQFDRYPRTSFAANRTGPIVGHAVPRTRAGDESAQGHMRSYGAGNETAFAHGAGSASAAGSPSVPRGRSADVAQGNGASPSGYPSTTRQPITRERQLPGSAAGVPRGDVAPNQDRQGTWSQPAPRGPASDAPRAQTRYAPRDMTPPSASPAPRSGAPAQRYESPSQRYQPPVQRSEPSPPRYQAPAQQRYEPSAPRYQAPAQQRYEPSAPRYQAPAQQRYESSAPRYQAPESRSAPAPHYSAPERSAPSAPPSHYNSGAGQSRSSSGGNSSSHRGRGGAPE